MTKYNNLPDIEIGAPEVYETGSEVLPSIPSETPPPPLSTDINSSSLHPRLSADRFKDAVLESSGCDYRIHPHPYRSTSGGGVGWVRTEHTDHGGGVGVATVLTSRRRIQTPVELYDAIMDAVGVLKTWLEKVQGGNDSKEGGGVGEPMMVLKNVERVKKELDGMKDRVVAESIGEKESVDTLIKMLESVKVPPSTDGDLNAGEKEKVDDSRDGVTYELFYTPDNATTVRMVEMAELEKRLTQLEKALGDSSSSVNVSQTLTQLEKDIQILTKPNEMEAISRKCKTLTAELDALLAKQREFDFMQQAEQRDAQVIHPQTKEKIDKLYTTLNKTDALADGLPALLDRLTALKQLHVEAATFASSLSHVSDDQERIQKELKLAQELCQTLETNLSMNCETIQKNMKALDERIRNLSK